jgi:hypothetical protein
MVKHIRVKQMWKYVHVNVDLSPDEQSHLASCPTCLKLFRICVVAEDPDNVDLDDSAEQQSA